MFEILSTKTIAPNIFEFKVKAPEIAAKACPGQFLIYRLHDRGERIPLTMKNWDTSKGSITIVFQVVGKSTLELSKLQPGDKIKDILGPLGTVPSVRKYGTVIVVAGGCGAAPSLPRARQLKEAGNYLITILGARQEELLVCELELNQVSDEIYITTDDGSKGTKGFVTTKLQELLESNRQIDYVYTVGPPIMMKNVAVTTKPFGVKTECSLNPIMVDGTGMCGACRVEIGGQTKFACVDGPEFDAHEVDFNLLIRRLDTYRSQEERASEHYKQMCAHGES
ncbi:MAG: sulfide/dihydroorotate dehydrogenase-like FAD/NAD-binding protein [Candidatus Odinarchaeota archaeon]